ncbi:MAG TPA: LL-diaminopimelate aminotransferase [Firmicutes bacterium]|jgi:LL-diaminopimelate aminotransferase|nr:LL-diaminopimelate aminotransferase [Bacillota bacterium]
MEFSKRTNGLTSAIFAQLEQRKQEQLAKCRPIINFSIGTPDLPPADHIMNVLQEEVAKPGNYIYAIRDLPELTEAVINWYQRRFQVDLQPEEIIAMNGSQDGLSHIALAIADPGDLVFTPDPCYPIFSVGPQLAEAIIYPIPLLKENHYLMDLERIPAAIAQKAKLLIVSYPNNPVTAMAPYEFYEKLVWFAKKYDIIVVHDNAYCELVYDGQKCGSFLALPGAKEVGIEFNSLSKTYNMPGCRISFAMGNRRIIERFRNLKSHLDYGIFVPIQKAAIAALNGPQECVNRTVRAYASRRNLLIDGLAEIGWPIDKPPATMFVWAAIPPKYTSSVEFTFDLLEQAGVIVVPGSSFGERGEGFVRLALVQPEVEIRKAIRAIKDCGILT